MDTGKSDRHKPLVFVSYAREDNKTHGNKKGWLDRLLPFLKRPLEQAGIELFIDDIIITSEYSSEIKAALDRATAAILLISPGFMVSDNIIDKELPVLLSRYKAGQLKIFPILLSHCVWDTTLIIYPDPENNHRKELFLLSDLILPGHKPEYPLDSLTGSEVNRVFEEITDRILLYHTQPEKKIQKHHIASNQQKE